MQENIIVRTTEFVQLILRQYIAEGDRVLDATMGNGLDTLALARMVGIHQGKGQVYAFDVQQEALDATGELLKKNGYEYFTVKDHHRSIENIVPDAAGSIYLYLDSHANLDRYIQGQLEAAVFNLGYLPGGNKEITTEAEAVLAAVKKTATLLKQNGLIAIVLYPGHQRGKVEKIMLLDYMKLLLPSAFHAELIETVNQPEDAPCIALITRKKG